MNWTTNPFGAITDQQGHKTKHWYGENWHSPRYSSYAGGLRTYHRPDGKRGCDATSHQKHFGGVARGTGSDYCRGKKSSLTPPAGYCPDGGNPARDTFCWASLFSGLLLAVEITRIGLMETWPARRVHPFYVDVFESSTGRFVRTTNPYIGSLLETEYTTFFFYRWEESDVDYPFELFWHSNYCLVLSFSNVWKAFSIGARLIGDHENHNILKGPSITNWVGYIVYWAFQAVLGSQA